MTTDSPSRRQTPHEKAASEHGGPAASPLKATVGEVFLPLYDALLSPNSDFVTSTRIKMSQARIDETVELFIARSLGYGAIVGLLSWVLSTAALFWIVSAIGFEAGPLIGLRLGNEQALETVQAVRTPALILISGLIFGTVGFIAGFAPLHVGAGLTASAREREINLLMPDVVSYMYALSVGGMNQLEIIEAVADAEAVYGEVSLEFESILRETTYFDTDYRSAIETRAVETPSDELSQFLADMLSIINTGGDLSDFLEDQTEKQLRSGKENQESLIEMLELFGEMYLNLSLLPLLLIVLISIMMVMGGATIEMMYGVIYAVIPVIGIGFIVLMSSVLPDEPGEGTLETTGNERISSPSVLDVTTTASFKNLTPRFGHIYRKEVWNRATEIGRKPQVLFTQKPHSTLIVTVPATILFLIAGLVSGIAPTTRAEIYTSLFPTVFYGIIPIFTILTPLTVFTLLQDRRQKQVTEGYSEALRKLSSANDTGQTLLKCFETVSETSTGVLSDEFAAIAAKTTGHGYSLREALIEFTNKFESPELARTNKLIIDAQETSSQISPVLVTAAQTSENQDRLRRKRLARTRMQVVMILLTFVVLTGVIAALQDQFIYTMADVGETIAANNSGSAGSGALAFSSIDPSEIGILFFHAVGLQAVTAGMLCSYLRTNSVKQTGLFTVPMLALGLVIFVVVI